MEGASPGTPRNREPSTWQAQIAAFTIAAVDARDPQAVIREACETLRQALGLDEAGALQFDGKEGRLVPVHGSLQLPTACGAPWQHRAGDDGDGEVRFIRNGVLVAAAGRNPIPADGIVAMIGPRGRPFGLLGGRWNVPHPVGEPQVVALRAVAGVIAGVAARHETSLELASASASYESLVETADDAILTLDDRGVLRFANRAMALLLQSSPQQLVGRPLADLVVDEDRATIERLCGARLREPADADARMRRHDGTLLWARIATSPITGPGGAVIGAMATVTDVTHQALAAQALSRQEEQLAEAQAIARIGSWALDLETGALSGSNELYRLLGVPPQSRELTLEMGESLIPSSSRDALRAMMEAGEARREIDAVHELVAFDGTRRWMHTRGRFVSNVVTGRTMVHGTTQDITERKAEQDAVLAREARLQFIVSHLPVAIWSTDETLRIVSMEGAGAADFHGEPKALEIAIGADPVAREATRSALRGVSMTFDTVADGRNVRIFVEPLRNASGAIVGTTGITFDVSAEVTAARASRELQAKLEHVLLELKVTFDSIPSPIVVLDQANRVVRLNAAALRLSRFDAYLDALGRDILEMGDAAVWRELRTACEETRHSRQIHSTRIRDDDDKHWDLVAAPWGAEDRKRTTVFATDVTAIAQLESSLQRSERMSALGTLVSGVAHEVRNPLFGISAALDALEATAGPAVLGPFTVSLRHQVGRMNDLMHDLLEYGKPAPPVFRQEPPNIVFDQAILSTRALAERANVRVELETPDSLPAIRMDRRRLLQVFENLLKNAIQHSTAGQIVRIRCSATLESLIVAVEDEGRGFTAEDLKHLFEPFYSRRTGGTGLGLSLVQRIIEEHGGGVEAANRNGGGAVITLRLPIGTSDAR